MELFKDQILNIINDRFTNEQLVEYVQVIAEKLELGSIKEIADRNNKSQQGVRGSNNFRKIKIGSVVLVTDKVKEDKLFN